MRSGHGCPRPYACFPSFRQACPKFLTRDVRTNDPRDVRGIRKRAEYTLARNQYSGTEKVPQRTFATKISPNFRVNFLVRSASKPLFYWVVPSNCSEDSLVLFVRFFGFGVLVWLPKYINNSPGVFSCIHPGVNTRAACMRDEINSTQIYFNILAPWM